LSRGTKPDLEQAAPVPFIIGAVEIAAEDLNLRHRSDGSKRAVVELGAFFWTERRVLSRLFAFIGSHLTLG